MSFKTILVVDDESLIRWSLKSRLEEAGFRVREAEDGKSALEYFDHRDGIDAMFLDLRLPDMDGLTILRRVKELDPDCEVIIMTAFGTPEAREEASRLGAHRLVDKPFNYEEMVRLATELIGNPTA